MRIKLANKKRKILRKVFGALSLSSALFIFEACYGHPQDFGNDVYIQGIVKSKITNQLIQGIKVSIENQPQYVITDSTGKFEIYTSRATEYNVKFEDLDSTQFGSFLPKDTVVTIADESIFLNVSLDE